MADHPARFPGVTNDAADHIITGRQAARLAALAPVPAASLAGKKLADAAASLRTYIDPKLLVFQKICGQVVKTDPAGNDLPVPFATVHVYDVDLALLAWSPPDSLYSWFFPFRTQREKLATVTTDECGRFCVWVPRFDIDHYLRWRLERRCYLTWLRKPSVEDILRARGVIPRPQPDPGPIRLDEHALTHAARVLDPRALARLRETSTVPRAGARAVEVDAPMARAAFVTATRPPLTEAAVATLAPASRARLAARVGVPVEALAKLDPGRVFGPFVRCVDVLVPQWTTVVDVPDLTFEVTQDIDGDGAQEVIYREGLFDVRWDASGIADVVLRADASAIAGPSCDIPDVGPCGDPAILFASNYPLQVANNPSVYHDGVSGYALLPNRPDANGVPGEGARTEPAQAPFTDPFYLVGCAERPGATHYRVYHQVDGGSATFLNGAYGPLMKVVGGTLKLLSVSPVEGQWYPIVPRADGWTPVGILAPVSEGGDHLHTFKLEFGAAAPGGAIAPIAGSQTAPVNLRIDATPPNVEFLALQWRHPDTSLAWQSLPIADCAVVARHGGARVQLRLALRVSADHLRDFSVTAQGCGPMLAPALITDGRDGLPVAAADAAAHWHTSAGDNVQTRELFYELPAGAPAGCYHFLVFAATRAFRPTGVVSGPDPAVAWRIDTAPVYVYPRISVALQ